MKTFKQVYVKEDTTTKNDVDKWVDELTDGKGLEPKVYLITDTFIQKLLDIIKK